MYVGLFLKEQRRDGAIEALHDLAEQVGRRGFVVKRSCKTPPPRGNLVHRALGVRQNKRRVQHFVAKSPADGSVAWDQ